MNGLATLSKFVYDALSKNLDGEIYIDDISRLLWSTDASIYQIIPVAVVTPKNIDDVTKVVKFCWKNEIPVHPRGAGSGLGGASIGKGIVLDFTRYMNTIIEMNPKHQWFIVQPGIRLSAIQKELHSYDLFLPPDPSSADYCAIGGNIGTNAGGSHSVKYGLMSDYTVNLTVVLSNGEVITTKPYKLNDPIYLYLKTEDTLEAKIYRDIENICNTNKNLIENGYPNVKYNITGYDLREIVKDNIIDITRLFVGSEGSLGTIVEIKMRSIKKPKYVLLMIAYLSNAYNMGKATWEALQENPSAVEVLDHTLINIAKEANPELAKKIPEELKYLLMIEFDGNDQEIIETQAMTVNKKITEEKKLAFYTEIASKKEDQEKLWEIRKTGLPLLGKINDFGRKSIPVIEDAAVPPEVLPEYLDELYYLMDEYNVKFAIYGHAGKGLLHTRPFLNLQKSEDISTMVEISQKSFNKVKELKGTVSGEHGDGRIRGQYIQEQYGKDMYNVLLQVKKTFDPKDIMNPGIKVTEKTLHLTENLRYGNNYERISEFDKGLLIHFQKAEWQNEIEMCHGCSKCTTILPVVNMCPIFKGKRTETATPKAKANILRSIISGKIDINNAMKSPKFKEIMFNCTGCQSCLVECPSNVNIPKIALQVKAQYVEQSGQPLNEYLLGSFGTLNHILSKISFFSNWLMGTRVSRWLGEKTIGITRHRKLPTIANQTFTSWFEKKFKSKRKDRAVRKVAYFVGCSANYTNPDIGRSLIEVFEENNIEVIVPDQKCCGLPMYTYGNVKRGKKHAQYSIDKFLPYVKQGYDIIVTCSSCGLSLKQEWYDLLGTDEAKQIADVTYHFSEYLLILREEGLLNHNFGNVSNTIGYHTSCHLKAQNTAINASTQLLDMIPGINLNKIEEGCCGICGSWGYKKENYEFSMNIGSELLKELNSPKNDIGVTDCPTCTLQMEHGSDKNILHPVEIIAKSYRNKIINDTPQ